MSTIDGKQVISALRRAMDSAGLKGEVRAYLVGYFGIEWNKLIGTLPSECPVAEVVSYHTAGLYDEMPIGTKLYVKPSPSISFELMRILQDHLVPESEYNSVEFDAIYGRLSDEQLVADIAKRLAAAPLPVQAQPIEQQEARLAIGGAIAYGRMGTNKPPSDDHWLMEYWQIGQQLADLGKTSAWDNVTPADDAVQAQPVEEDQAKKKIGGQIAQVGMNATTATTDGSHATKIASLSTDHAAPAVAPVEAIKSIDTPEFTGRLICYAINPTGEYAGIVDHIDNHVRRVVDAALTKKGGTA